MSFYSPYEFYDILDAINQRNALAAEQQQRQRRYANAANATNGSRRGPGASRPVHLGAAQPASGRPAYRYAYGGGPEAGSANGTHGFPRAFYVNPHGGVNRGRNFVYRNPAYPFALFPFTTASGADYDDDYDAAEEQGDDDNENEGENVYTLNDVLNLINRHQSAHPETYELIIRPPATAAANAAANAVADAVTDAEEKKEQQQDNDEIMAENNANNEKAEVREFDLADLIRQALLGGSAETETGTETEAEANEKPEPKANISATADATADAASKIDGTPASALVAPDLVKDPSTSAPTSDLKKEVKPPLQKRNSFINKAKTPVNKVSSFHLSCPSPVHDPLQVSQPQLDSNLPFSPQIDVYDKPTLYKVVLALPGASKSSFEVDFHPSNHELFIRGSTSNKDKLVSKATSQGNELDDAEELQYLKVSEINFGSFERSIKFPILPRIKDEEIKAKYFNGLLEVIVPKLPEKKEDVKPKKRVTVEEVEDEELLFEEGLKKL